MTCAQIITQPVLQPTFIKITTRKDISKTIHRKKTNTAVGHDGISVYALKTVWRAYDRDPD